MVSFLTAALMVSLITGATTSVTNIPQVGPHYLLFTFEKNENPQNIMEIYTLLNRDCTLASKAGKPVLGYYWLMDGRSYKPVHPLIRLGIENRLRVEPSSLSKHSVTMTIADLKKLNHDLASDQILITSEHQGGGCTVEALVKMGPSDHGAVLWVTKIYSEARKTWLPPFRKLTSLTFEGVDVQTGQRLHRTFSAKR